jgi:hypothetical protein
VAIDVEVTIYGEYLLGKTNLTLKYSYFGVIIIDWFDSFMVKKRERERERESFVVATA